MLCCNAVVTSSIERTYMTHARTYLRYFMYNTHARRWIWSQDTKQSRDSLLNDCNSVWARMPVTHIQLTSYRWKVFLRVSSLGGEVSVMIYHDWSDWSSESLTAHSLIFLHNWISLFSGWRYRAALSFQKKRARFLVQHCHQSSVCTWTARKVTSGGDLHKVIGLFFETDFSISQYLENLKEISGKCTTR